MKHFTTYSFMILIVTGLIFAQSCKNDDDEEPTPSNNEEFIATSASFSDWMTWSLDATNSGPDPALGPAHAGNDSTVTRRVYFKDGQAPVNGVYPVGTMIVKHSSNDSLTVNEFSALVKRGNNYDPDGNDWEYFILNADGTIATDTTGAELRGSNLLGGMCFGCHLQAKSKDFVFSK